MTDCTRKGVFIIFFVLFINLVPSLAIKFYEGTETYDYDCSAKFQPSKEFTCACLSGVWKLFKSDCEEINTVGAAQNYCFEIPTGDSVKRIEKILNLPDDISVRLKNGSLIYINANTVISLEVTDIITTGSEWSITSDQLTSPSCLSPVKENYCQFSLGTANTGTKFNKGCSPAMPKIPSKNCELIQKQNENICETSNPGKARAFFGAPGMNLTIVTDPSSLVDDEDFFNGTMTQSRDEITEELWNFIDKGLDDILKLNKVNKTGNKTAVNNENSTGNTTLGKKYSRVPIFHLIQLSRDVMQKTCPDFYVNPKFLDMAVYSFLQMQKKVLKQEDYQSEYFGYKRIIKALQTCYANSTVYPFFNNFSCSENGEPTGLFKNRLNGSDEVNIPFSSIPISREPIIETVWKIFYNAHSRCFEYFDQSFNDHHRYATWITPLFQNSVNDIWLNGSSDNVVYGNIFGKMLDIQTRIAYCTGFARLDSEYPWDLPIPPRMEDYSSNSTNKTRRRRSVQAKPGQCVEPTQLPVC